jgi:hypothetical protein
VPSRRELRRQSVEGLESRMALLGLTPGYTEQDIASGWISNSASSSA